MMCEYDVFVSHNRKNKPWVRMFVALLRNEGLSVFFDEDSIPFGRDIVHAIEEGKKGGQIYFEWVKKLYPG
jgi:hypothetical protein